MLREKSCIEESKSIHKGLIFDFLEDNENFSEEDKIILESVPTKEWKFLAREISFSKVCYLKCNSCTLNYSLEEIAKKILEIGKDKLNELYNSSLEGKCLKNKQRKCS